MVPHYQGRQGHARGRQQDANHIQDYAKAIPDFSLLRARLDKEVGPYQKGKNTEEPIIVGIKEGWTWPDALG